MLTIKNKAEVAEIYLSGEVVDDDEGGWLSYWREGNSVGYVFPQKIKEQLDAIGVNTPIEMHINSCGGSVFAGVAIANFIANHKGKTTCIIDGIAASIASQIFFSADVSKMPSNAYLMLHRPFTALSGNAEELRKAAEVLDTLQAGLETTYKQKALEGVTAEDIHNMVNAETWLTGTEAAEKFKIKLMNPVKTLNAIGSADKLKAQGLKVPSTLNFLPEISAENELKDKIKVALARAKGAMINV